MSDSYFRSDAWYEHVTKAHDNFEVTGIERTDQVTWVEAEASTGSVYRVVASILPGPFSMTALGANALVSVVAPWKAAYAMIFGGGAELHSDYVLEKLGGGRAWTPGNGMGQMHAGDLWALTVTVGLALSRPVFMDGSSFEGKFSQAGTIRDLVDQTLAREEARVPDRMGRVWGETFGGRDR